LGDRTTLADVEKAIEPVRYPLFGRLVGLRSQYREITIALQAIGVDDRTAIGVRQFQSESRFAARGRACNDENWGRRVSLFPIPLVVRGTGEGARRRMIIVLTLIAGPRDRSHLTHLVAAVAATVGSTTDPVWLAPEACDIVVDAVDPAPVEIAARAIVGDAPVDVVVQPMAGRRKQLLVADMESTIIENEMLDELADFVGIWPQVSKITRRAMNGEIDFAAALEARVRLLAGMDDRVLDQAAERIRVAQGARQLVATMRAAGSVTALVSGGFTVFADRVAAELGFDHVVANQLDLSDGRITGTVRRPFVTGETKRDTLFTLAIEHGIAPDRSIAVGDGANDLPMLTAAGIGIAFRAKPSVAASSRWRIDHSDLTGLLYIQGYLEGEIIEGTT
jgi:phosphoserine phosphatase